MGSVDDQLAAIASLDRALLRAGVDYWLFGGWAVDFWVGDLTRPHDDIDVGAWRTDFDAIRTALVAAGWEHRPSPEDLVGTRYRLASAEAELTFFEPGPAGEVVVPLPTGPVVMSPEPFEDVRRSLRGVTCRTIPLEVLRAGKATPREGAAESAKDRADHAALSRLVDER